MNDTLKKIRTHGYWETSIRPGLFDKALIPDLLSLEGIIRSASVQMRGWDFPHFGREPARRGIDRIEYRSDWSDHIELWRFYQSGLFFHSMAIRSDWADSSLFSRSEDPLPPGSVLLVIDTLYHVVEIFKLAARLASGPLAGPTLVVEVKLVGLKGRQLLLDTPDRAGFSYPRVADVSECPQELTLTRDEAIGKARPSAYEASRQLYTRFGWSPSDDLLEAMVDELRRSGFRV